jgi:hypothetical protein
MRSDLVEERQRVRVEAAQKLILRWLANGASTDDAMLGALGIRADVYVVAVRELEEQGLMVLGTWGELKVWRKC